MVIRCLDCQGETDLAWVLVPAFRAVAGYRCEECGLRFSVEFAPHKDCRWEFSRPHKVTE